MQWKLHGLLLFSKLFFLSEIACWDFEKNIGVDQNIFFALSRTFWKFRDKRLLPYAFSNLKSEISTKVIQRHFQSNLYKFFEFVHFWLSCELLFSYLDTRDPHACHPIFSRLFTQWKQYFFNFFLCDGFVHVTRKRQKSKNFKWDQSPTTKKKNVQNLIKLTFVSLILYIS